MFIFILDSGIINLPLMDAGTWTQQIDLGEENETSASWEENETLVACISDCLYI